MCWWSGASWPTTCGPAEVWPEFGAHGKDRVTLRHVLLHTAGVPAPPYDTTVEEELCDRDHMCAVLAEAEPWWEPATRFGYHAKTFDILLGEIVRRATGRTLSWWLREVVTVPFGIGGDVHFGVPEELLDRVARSQPPNRTAAPAARAGIAGSTGRCPPASGPTPAYADIDSGVAVAVMRSRFDSDLLPGEGGRRKVTSFEGVARW